MRIYSKLCSQFWTGSTGRALRGDLYAQVVAVYLISSPHSNMLGVFYCPVQYISYETGTPFKGASKGLRRLCEEGFCVYDDVLEVVWVREFARFQVGERLKEADNRVKDLQKRFVEIPSIAIRRAFFDRYGDVFHLSFGEKEAAAGSPFEAPSKPVTVTVTVTESVTVKEKEICVPQTAAEPTDTGSRKKNGFVVPSSEEVKAYCQERGNRVDPEKWHDFYSSKGWMVGKNKMRDWRAAVRTWERNQQEGKNEGFSGCVGFVKPKPGPGTDWLA